MAGQERATVVALVRDVDATSVDAWAAGYVADESIITRSTTWEQLYGLAKTREELARLRDHMADKSINLRPAFML